MTRTLALAALLIAGPLAAVAQDGPRLAFSLGAGVSAVPGYFGSDELEVGPSVAFEFGGLSLGPLSFGSFDDAVPTGFGFRGSFRYVPERTEDEFEELAGLNDVDAAFELGGGLRYAESWWEAFATARVGIGGHSEVAGELGMDLIARPSDRLELRAGPRISLGTDGYADTYFGVSDEEAAASALAGTDLTAFDAEGGVLASGIELGATYDLSDRWGLSASARYDRLQQDAARSPITEEDGQVSASVELTRRFDFRF